MKITAALFAGLCAILVPVLLAAPVNAQATRTWVSGVGADENPCSCTAPCKTFAGAISKTFINGEINCLDPGGFGTLTITKSITINCQEQVASILASGTTAITINIGASANDPLRTARLQTSTSMARARVEPSGREPESTGSTSSIPAPCSSITC